MPRLINGWGLRLSECSLETTADKRKRDQIRSVESKKSMDVFEVESCVRGHHIYKHVWTHSLEKTCPREIENTKDPFHAFVVAVVCRSTVVGHAP